MMYFPMYSGEARSTYVVVRAQQEAASMASPIQKVIAHMDAEHAVSDILTMEQVIGRSTTDANFSVTLTLGFAALSLVLASVGLYGVLSFWWRNAGARLECASRWEHRAARCCGWRWRMESVQRSWPSRLG